MVKHALGAAAVDTKTAHWSLFVLEFTYFTRPFLKFTSSVVYKVVTVLSFVDTFLFRLVRPETRSSGWPRW